MTVVQSGYGTVTVTPWTRKTNPCFVRAAMIRPASLLPFALLSLAPFSHAATLAGLWEFNNPSNIGQATVGNDLVVVGTAPAHSATTADSASTSLGGVITTVGGTANYLRSL
ncbi:MAG: hypothetical protein EOP85_22515, partial [Verrucomicrobiaceae bacterium]